MSRETASREVRRAVDALGMTRLAFAEKARVDPGTLGDFLDGKRWAQAPTRRKIELALGWPAGRISDLEHEAKIAHAEGIEQAIEADEDLHPAAKAHLLNQLELLRLIPPGVPIQALLQERRRRSARKQTVASPESDPTHDQVTDRLSTSLAAVSDQGDTLPASPHPARSNRPRK